MCGIAGLGVDLYTRRLEIREPALHRVLRKSMLHLTGLGVGALELDAELVHEKRPKHAMTTPDGGTDLAAADT